MSEKRSRNWVFILYPESAPEDWKETLSNLHLEFICSPLHNMDTDINGELKKPHYHIILAFSGHKSFEQIKEITDSLNCPIPQVCVSMRGAVRYLIHFDDPQKYQYNKDDIFVYGGLDLEEYFKFSTSCKRTIILEMMEFINEHDVLEFADFVEYSALNRPDDWFQLLNESQTYFFSQYIKSRRGRAEKKSLSNTVK